MLRYSFTDMLPELKYLKLNNMPDDKNPKIVTKGASPMVSDLLPEIRSQFQFVKDYASSPKDRKSVV